MFAWCGGNTFNFFFSFGNHCELDIASKVGFPNTWKAYSSTEDANFTGE
jgi:hypothetical protein